MQARYLSGMYPLAEFGPLLRTPAGHVGMDQADRWIGLTDGGNGLEDRLRENFPRVEVVILDFLPPGREAHRAGATAPSRGRGHRPRTQARRWRQLLKEEGGAVLGRS